MSGNLSKKLNKRITIQTYTNTSDGMGGHTTAWTDAATIWAAIEPRTAKQLGYAEGTAHETLHRVTIRYNDDYDTADLQQIKYSNRVFKILSVVNPEEASKSLQLICEEVRP